MEILLLAQKTVINNSFKQWKAHFNHMFFKSDCELYASRFTEFYIIIYSAHLLFLSFFPQRTFEICEIYSVHFIAQFYLVQLLMGPRVAYSFVINECICSSGKNNLKLVTVRVSYVSKIKGLKTNNDKKKYKQTIQNSNNNNKRLLTE